MNQAHCSCMNSSTTEICIFSNTARSANLAVRIFLCMPLWLLLCLHGCVWQSQTGLFYSVSTLNKQHLLIPGHCLKLQSGHLFLILSVQTKLFFCVVSFAFVVVWRGHGARRTLERAQTVCGWTRCAAQAMSSLWSSVQKVPGGSTTVCTLRTPECPAPPLQVEQLHQTGNLTHILLWECLIMTDCSHL